MLMAKKTIAKIPNRELIIFSLSIKLNKTNINLMLVYNILYVII